MHRSINRLIDKCRSIKNERLKQQLGFCGEFVRFNGNIFITHPPKVQIGNNVHIGDRAYFVTEGGLSIGDNTHISRNVTIYTANHNYEGNALPYDDSFLFEPVVIQKNVWIGMNVSIVPGVRIGEGAIVGMGSVIASDVAPLTIVGGAPQRILKERNTGHYQDLERRQKYGGINGHLLTIEEISLYRTKGV